MKAAVLFKEGFEEIEALSVVDVLRRANVVCQMIGMDEMVVRSSHGIEVNMNQLFSQDIYDYDIVILPGGMPGAASLRDDDRVMDILRDFNEKNKWIGAICAGPIALERAEVIKGKKYTCFPGCEDEIPSGLHQGTFTCVDQNIITAKGPAAALEFAYTILDHLGYDSKQIAHDMQYDDIRK